MALLVVGSLATATAASAAPPQIISISVGEGSVTATGVVLYGSIDPESSSTTYRFEYLTQAAYEANLEAVPARDGFSGSSFAPVGGAGPVGAGATAVPVSQHIAGLAPATAYRYRLRAANAAGESVFSISHPFSTQAPTNAFELLDHRGWELVSPIDKGGGAIQPPGTISGGGVFQAAAAGGAFTYGSADSFGAGAQGGPSGSQYLSARGAGGWATANITTPLLSGSYGSEPDGVPYQLFSGDLGRALMSNGERCRGQAGGGCPVANPPLPGTGAPAGYRDYYRRNPYGGFESLLSAADVSYTTLGPDRFEVKLVAATPDLSHVILSSCAALAAGVPEVPAAEGCDPAAQSLYEWSGGALAPINLLPGQASATPGARIAASAGAVSADGSRVYFTAAGNLYLRDHGVTKVVLEGAEAGAFAAASADGSLAYLVDEGDLLGYAAATGALTTLAGGGGVEGVLGISADGSRVYYASEGAVYLRSGGAVTEVASSAAPGDWPPATGTARASADGSHLLFLSDAELTGYPSEGQTEAFLYGPPPGGAAPLLTCVSCNPSGERPQGPATIPGARPNGAGPDATDVYKPRVLSADGARVFFETADSLVPQDTDGSIDVYEWEANGEGSCARGGGCVQLISGGRDAERSYFLDADESGTDAFFLTAASLYPPDPGSYDVYDAREGGGFAVPAQPIPCVADACQVLPEAPEDPTPGTLTPSQGNPPLKIAKEAAGKPGHAKHKHRRHRRRRHRRHTRHKPHAGRGAGKHGGGHRGGRR